MKSLILSPLLFSSSIFAQQPLMEGWDVSTNEAGATTFISKNATATIIIGKMPGFDPAKTNDQLLQAASSLDKPEACAGFSKAVPLRVLNGRATQMSIDTSRYNCTVLIGQANKDSFVVLALEDHKANAGTRDRAQMLLAQRLGPDTAIPAPTTQQALTPAKGTSNVVAVFYESKMILMAGGPAGSLVNFENLTMLFANGEACYNCMDEWIKDPNFTAYRRSKPEDVGTWRKVGAKYIVSYPGSKTTSDFDAARSLRPAAANFRIHNSFKTSGIITSGSSENYTTAAYNDWLEFNPDGQFVYSSDGSFFGIGNGGSVSGSSAKKGRSGRYSINGFQIQFAYDDGEIKTASFAYDPNDKDYVIIDGSIYTHSSKD
jgi:hypothetical protein